MAKWTAREMKILASYRGRGDLRRILSLLPRHGRRAVWERIKEKRYRAKYLLDYNSSATVDPSIAGVHK